MCKEKSGRDRGGCFKEDFVESFRLGEKCRVITLFKKEVLSRRPQGNHYSPVRLVGAGFDVSGSGSVSGGGSVNEDSCCSFRRR